MVAVKAARRSPIGSAAHAGRGEIGPAEHLLADDQLDRLLVVRVFHEFPDLRDAEPRQLLLGLEIDLGEDVDGLVAHPVRALRFQARPVEAAQAVDLAALHGEQDIGGALVAADQLEQDAGRFFGAY